MSFLIKLAERGINLSPLVIVTIEDSLLTKCFAPWAVKQRRVLESMVAYHGPKWTEHL